MFFYQQLPHPAVIMAQNSDNQNRPKWKIKNMILLIKNMILLIQGPAFVLYPIFKLVTQPG